MDRYDITFVGHMATGMIVPFEGAPFLEPGSPVLFTAIAASCTGKRLAAVTKVMETDAYLLEPLKAAGIDLFVRPGGISRYRVVFPSADVDERRPYLIGAGDHLTIEDMPALAPCLVHLCCMDNREVQVDLMRALRARGFRLSVDMQGFVLQPDAKTGAVHHKDVPEKREILEMVDFVKLDAVEGAILTGETSVREQAEVLAGWGKGEMVITSSEGVFARSGGTSAFARFTNRSTQGRMGRGDTVMGSYLARRLDHSLEESLGFATALTSIKMESRGPFTGSVSDVLDRMARSAPG
jgi:sugar/nucleoside kinase (ribokinase family)